jgi:hypothetical protein
MLRYMIASASHNAILAADYDNGEAIIRSYYNHLLFCMMLMM